MPHWQQADATYFVTFRLADSLSSDARARLSELRKLSTAEGFSWIDGYLDAGSGSCIFNQTIHAVVVESALRHFDGTRYNLGAFVIMPNHVHALVQPATGFSLRGVIQGWKSYTSHQIKRAGVIHGPLWQDESFDRIVRDMDELRRFHDYIRANPTQAGLRPDTFISGTGSADWFHSKQ